MRFWDRYSRTLWKELVYRQINTAGENDASKTASESYTRYTIVPGESAGA